MVSSDYVRHSQKNPTETQPPWVVLLEMSAILLGFFLATSLSVLDRAFFKRDVPLPEVVGAIGVLALALSALAVAGVRMGYRTREWAKVVVTGFIAFLVSWWAL